MLAHLTRGPLLRCAFAVSVAAQIVLLVAPMHAVSQD